MDTIKNEPVLVTNLITAVGVALGAFGLNISKEQLGAVVMVWVAAAAIWARSKVSPV